MEDSRVQFGRSAELYLTSAVHSNPVALQRLVEIVQPAGGIIADVATGAGHTAFAFAPYVDTVLATDITPDMLAVTRRAAAERGLANLDVSFAQAECLPFRSSSLNGITCRVGAHHFRDVKAFVAEARRVLAHDGWFLLVDTTGSEDKASDEQLDAFERLRDPSHVRNYPPSQWRQLLETAGFTVKHEELTKKKLEMEDWMDRMHVKPAAKAELREMVNMATAGFREYLAPFESEGKVWFHLDEITMLAR